MGNPGTVRFLAGITLACTLASCSSYQYQPGEKIALAGGLADLATTAIGKGQGLQEANPVFGNGDNALLIQVAVTLAIHWAIRQWMEDKPPAYQLRVWKYTGMLRFTVAGWNTGQIIKETQQ